MFFFSRSLKTNRFLQIAITVLPDTVKFYHIINELLVTWFGYSHRDSLYKFVLTVLWLEISLTLNDNTRYSLGCFAVKLEDPRGPLDTPAATQCSHTTATSSGASNASGDSLDHDAAVRVDMRRLSIFANAIQGLAQWPGIHLICSLFPYWTFRNKT